MSNGQKWLLLLMCVCVMAIPFILMLTPPSSKLKTDTNTSKIKKSPVSASVSTPASGVFIIPPGGKEVNRDTAGQRVAYYNVGDKIVIIPLTPSPNRLFLINETISPARIRGNGLSGRVSKLGEKNYLRFVNYGDKEEKIKTPRVN